VKRTAADGLFTESSFFLRHPSRVVTNELRFLAGGSGMFGMVAGVVLIAAGAIILLNNLGIAHFSLNEIFHKWWPVLLIIAGISFLTKRIKK
jgi:uncharacterized membrane protein